MTAKKTTRKEPATIHVQNGLLELQVFILYHPSLGLFWNLAIPLATVLPITSRDVSHRIIPATRTICVEPFPVLGNRAERDDDLNARQSESTIV